MDPSYSNRYMNLGDSQDYSNTQYYQNSLVFPNPSQDLVNENIETSQNTENQTRGNKWDVAEDVALMSALCVTSENKTLAKNQKKTNFWAQVKNLYDAAQKENPENLGTRNEFQMKGRFKHRNENAQKWVGAYQEAYRNRRSGMNHKDIESEAHKIYEQGKAKFNDSVVFYEVVCKNQKWALNINHDTRCSHPECEVGNEESGGSTKRSRTTKEGEYCDNSNPDMPTIGGSTIHSPIGKEAAKREATKRKAKGKVSNEFYDELRALRLTRDGEFEL